MLRDGRAIFGYLRSIDQFGEYQFWLFSELCGVKYLTEIYKFCSSANLALHQTVERIYIGNEYGEIDRGVFLIRGENVVLCGEVVSNLTNSLANQARIVLLTSSLSKHLKDDDRGEVQTGYTKVPIEIILAKQAVQVEEKRNRDKLKFKAMQERGMLMQADALTEEL